MITAPQKVREKVATPAHYHLTINGVRCCSGGVLANDGVPATWRTLGAARLALKSVKAYRQGALGIDRCHCTNTLRDVVKAERPWYR